MSYDEIKAKCLRERSLFEDPHFPADNSSLYYDKKKKPPPTFKWKRPTKMKFLGISKTPEFFVEEESRFDIQQGELGDCWMLASMACLSMRPDLFDKVVPDAGQSFTKDYAGIFRFRIWRFGEWVDVIIDDRLPTAKYDKDGRPTTNRRLVYATSSEQNEFWSALLQKAYAKLCGCYEALNGGRPRDSMEDFTGGIGESCELKPEGRDKIWRILAKGDERKSLICCGTAAGPETDGRLRNGLVAGHAYSVTKVGSCNTKKSGNLQMVRVRNPWGSHDDDWKGEWSDEHMPAKLKLLSDFEKQVIGFEDPKKDGEFWMTIEEFVSSFEGGLDICHLNPEYFANNDAALNETHWNVKCYVGCWKEEISAGGFVDDKKFWKNQQYRFEVVDVDEDDNKDAGTVIIALMQKDRRKNRLKDLQICFAVYKLSSPSSVPLDKNYNFRDISNINTRPSKRREVCERLELRPGSYCVVPYRMPAKHAANDGDFILRIFIEKPFTSR